jgi:hypothetical protein
MGFLGVFGRRKGKKGAQGASKREVDNSNKPDTTFLVFGEDESKPAVVVKPKPLPVARTSVRSSSNQPAISGTDFNDRKSVGAALAASAANIVQLRKSQKVTRPIDDSEDDDVGHDTSDHHGTTADEKARSGSNSSTNSNKSGADVAAGEGRRAPVASARLAVTSLASRPTVPRGARRAPTMSRQFQGNTAKGLLANVSAEDLAHAKRNAEEAKAQAEHSSSSSEGSASEKTADSEQSNGATSSGAAEEAAKAKELAVTSPLRMNLTLDRKRAERKKSNGNTVHPLSVRIKAGYEFFEKDGTTYRVRSGWRKSLSRSTTFDGYGVYLMKTERDWELVRDPQLKVDLLTELRAVRPGRSSSAGRMSLHRRGSGASSSTIRDRASRKLSGSALRSNSIAAEAEAAYRARMLGQKHASSSRGDEKHARSKTAGAVMSTGPDGEVVADEIVSFDDDNDDTDDDETDGGQSASSSSASGSTSSLTTAGSEASAAEGSDKAGDDVDDEAVPALLKADDEDASVVAAAKAKKKKSSKKKKKSKKTTTTGGGKKAPTEEPTTAATSATKSSSSANTAKKKKKKKKKKKVTTTTSTTAKAKSDVRDRNESAGSVESGDWIVTVKTTAPEPQSWPGAPADLVDMKRRKSVRDLAAMFDH